MTRSKKSSKKIQSLIFLMLVTIILGITATYAWFSTQRDVEIAGMRLNVEVAESMQVSIDGEKWTQSIQIADMRQFYGTYSETGSEGFAVFQAKDVDEGGNLNYVPTELVPVSTAGEVSAGKLQFVQGTIGTNADGSQSLTDITLCSETDITTSATIGTKEGNNDKHPYLVFDMYLRNISAKTEGIDELLLNAGSRVFVNLSRTDDGEQEGKGVSGTGLEYSARVGFIIYGNTVSVTAEDDATLGTIGEQVRGITHNNSEVAAIWEPNYKNHTQYVIDNNGREITSEFQVIGTYGIKSAVASTADKTVANVNADTDANSDGIEDTNANLVRVKTFKTSYSTAYGGTEEKEVITNTAGNSIGLAPNQISKVRVYIWLEGQDPDCIDMASTGDKLNVDLKLTKNTNTVNENTYTENNGAGAGGATYVTADTLPVADYGKYVTNYEPTNGVNDEGTKWRIFYADEEDDNIYLISDSYVPIANEDETKMYFFPPSMFTSGRYMFDLMDATNHDRTSLTSDIASKWLKALTDYLVIEENIVLTNQCLTAYLLDTNGWSGFKDNTYAEYAVGGPTIELFAASYNKTHPDSKKLQVYSVNEEGYIMQWENTVDVSGIISELDTGEGLYVATFGKMWLASPFGGMLGNYENMYVVNSNGEITNGGVYEVSGSRPIICLKDTVKLEKQADGNYKIVQ